MDGRGVQSLLLCAALVGVVLGGIPLVASDAPSTAPAVDDTIDGTDADADSPATDDPTNETADDDPTNDTDDDPTNDTDDDPTNDTDNETTPPGDTDPTDPSLAGYDDVVVEIRLAGNGSAAWTVEYRYRLDDGNESVDWEALVEDIDERNEAYVESFEERWAATVSDAENRTGREMTASSFAVETDESQLPHDYGHVRFSFQWSSFAHVEVNRIEAGDAIEGFVLDERTELRLSWPEGYERIAVEPTPDDTRETAVIWRGSSTDFVEGEPRIELIQAGGDPIRGSEDPDDGVSLPWLAAIGLLFLVIVGVAGWMRAREGPGTRTANGGGGPTGDAAAGPGPPPELLSNEERVLALLEDNGGRLKQQEVVSRLGWTEAKTSQVVGTLRESDRIEVFRIGRENVLTLSDEER